jgi:hypothetical protein
MIEQIDARLYWQRGLFTLAVSLASNDGRSAGVVRQNELVPADPHCGTAQYLRTYLHPADNPKPPKPDHQ